MLHHNRRPRHRSCFEQLEIRTVLDCAGLLTGEIDFAQSEWVNDKNDGTLQFASLRVGVGMSNSGPGEVLDDDAVISVRDHELTVGQVKAYLHGFADSIGTNSFIETQDIRFSAWGVGSGSTSNRFEEYIVDQLANRETCSGLRFAGSVQFNLPGTGGEFFTGGFLDLTADGVGGLLRGGDIAEVVDSYEIASDGVRTTLTVQAQFGEMEFVINDDQTLTDEFDRTWQPESDYEIIDPIAADEVLGDIDGSGVVDFADFLILSSTFGTDAVDADLDESGKVDFADFLLLSNNFGKQA